LAFTSIIRIFQETYVFTYHFALKVIKIGASMAKLRFVLSK